MTPQEYAEKYKFPISKVVYEHCITENAYRRYTLSTKNKSNPSPITCRVTQLLTFIRENGLEPPIPIFFE